MAVERAGVFLFVILFPNLVLVSFLFSPVLALEG